MKKLKSNLKYHFSKSSLFWRTFIIISLLLIVPFVSMSIIFTSNTLKNMRNEISSENASALKSAANILDDTLIECDTMSTYIAGNESTQLFALNGYTRDSFFDMVRLAKTLPITYKYIDSIYIYSERTDIIMSNEAFLYTDEFSDMGWLDDYQNVVNQKGVIVPCYKNGTYPYLITIIKPIYVADEKTGAVIMNINSQSLYNSILLGKYSASGQEMYLAGVQGHIILSKDISNFGKTLTEIGFPPDYEFSEKQDKCLINDENYTVLSSDSSLKGYKYVSAYSMSIYEDRIFKVRAQLILISLSLLIFGFVLAYFASVKSYAPLREIISFLDMTNSESNITTQDKNEILYIINSIKLHIEDKTKMEEILEERMKMLKQAQYDMLQAQINPHFLYNTLETINWMAYDIAGGENPVSAALVNLAGFFRNSLSFSGYLITADEEIKYTKDYIKILHLRYADLFSVKWDIDEDILSCKVIKMCLQPIIENAVYHGFKPKGSEGLLTITGRLEGSNILFTISDDGIGMSDDDVKALNAGFNTNVYTSISHHIGLANVNKRIKILYGENYGLSVSSKEGKGTSVRIIIPATQQ